MDLVPYKIDPSVRLTYPRNMVQGFSEQHKNPLFYSDLANNANGKRRGPKRFWMWGWPVCHRIGWNPIITEVINITCNCTVTEHHNTNLRQHEWGSKLPHPNRHCKDMHCNSSMATPWKWQQEPWRCRLWPMTLWKRGIVTRGKEII